MSQTHQPIKHLVLMKKKRIFRFVLHEEIQKYEAQGYKFASHIRGNHGVYSVIMEKVDDNSWRLPDRNAKAH